MRTLITYKKVLIKSQDFFAFMSIKWKDMKIITLIFAQLPIDILMLNLQSLSVKKDVQTVLHVMIASIKLIHWD
jgi:hypothetical protein